MRTGAPSWRQRTVGYTACIHPPPVNAYFSPRARSTWPRIITCLCKKRRGEEGGEGEDDRSCRTTYYVVHITSPGGTRLRVLNLSYILLSRLRVLRSTYNRSGGDEATHTKSIVRVALSKIKMADLCFQKHVKFSLRSKPLHKLDPICLKKRDNENIFK